MNASDPTTATGSAGSRFDQPAERSRLDSVAEALRDRGLDARVVSDRAEIRGIVDELIPDDARVYNTTSRTVDELGIADDIKASTRYRSVRTVTETLDPATQMDEFRRNVASMDVVIGSVHAITDDGVVVIASASGSQHAAYAFGASRVIWVVGAQKMVADLAEAFTRIEQHCLPLESERLQRVYGMPSFIGKELIIHGERPGRITVLLLEEAIGF